MMFCDILPGMNSEVFPLILINDHKQQEAALKNILELAAICEAELRSIGIQPAAQIRWTVNTRATRRWGCCKKSGPDAYEISISSRLLQDDVEIQAVKDTIMHELLHTVKGTKGHTGLWLKLAAQVNQRLPQYHIQRTASYEEKGIEPVPARYLLRCTHCGRDFSRQKMSNLVRAPQNYRCGACGHPLERIK